MHSPSKEFTHPISSPTPARPRINVTGYRYSDTDSEDDGDDEGKRWKKGKRGGLIGIAEARGGKSAGFFGGGGELGQRRVRGREEGSSSSSEDEVEVVEGDVAVGKGKKRGKYKGRVVDDQDDEDERLKREIRERKMKRSSDSAAVVVDGGRGGVRNRNIVLIDESEEGAESTEERNLKTWIRAKRRKERGDRSLVNGDVDEKEVSMEDRKDKRKEKGKTKGRDKKKKDVVEVLGDDEDGVEETVEVRVPQLSKRRGRRAKHDEAEEVQVDEDHATGKRKTRNDSSYATSTRASKRDRREKAEESKGKKRSWVSSEEENDEDEDVVRPAGKRGKLRHPPVTNREKEKKEEAEAEKEKGADEEVPPDSGIQVTQAMKDKVKSWMIESDNEEVEDVNVNKVSGDSGLGGQARARLTEKKEKGRRGKKVVIDDDDDEEEGGNAEKEDMEEAFVHSEANESDREDSGGEPIPQQRTRSGRGGKEPIFDLNDDDDDDLPIITPSRRRQLKPAGKSSPIVMAEEDSDLGSDAELAAQTPVMKSRLRYEDSPKKLTLFQRKLKELNAKRQGVDLVSEEDEEASGKALYDSDTSGEAGNVLDDIEDEEEEEEAVVAERGRRNGGLDSDIESFIVTDDESDPLGAPDDDDNVGGPIVRIPIQFTSQSHASLKNHFKTVLQYMLNLLLNPSFPKDDEYFTYALHSVDRKVDSFRDSVLKSEVWKGDFMRALKSRPGFEFDPHGGDGWEDHCMACNRRDRNASYTVRFTGKRYDPDTFSDYESDSDSGDSEDAVGNIIPPSGQPFPVGRYCYERAEITHSFWHWKKGLRTALEGVLTQMGVFEQEVVRKLDKMKGEERWRWVDAKLGELERRGDVDLLWDMFQAQMKRAEEFMSRPRRYFMK